MYIYTYIPEVMDLKPKITKNNVAVQKLLYACAACAGEVLTWVKEVKLAA